MATTPVTNTVKKQTVLPLQDPNNPNAPAQIVPQQPDSQGVQNAAYQSGVQLNKQAQQGFSSPLAQSVSAQTTKLLADPNQGQNYQQQIDTRLAQEDRNRAQTLETARAGLGRASGSSLNQTALMNIALQGNEARADLQTQLENDAAKKQQENLLAALAAGRAGTQTEQDVYNTNINALKTAIGAPDIERQGAITAKEAASTRNWQAEQNDLDRQLEIKKQAGDIAGQKEIEQLKAKLTLEQMASEQNWKGIQNQLDRDIQTSMQSNDINAVRQNLLTQLDYNKQEAAAGRTFTAEQNAMNRILETTLKTMDIDSAKVLTELKGKIDSGMLTQEQDWKTAQAALDRSAAEALQKGDIQGQIAITQLKGEIDQLAQKAQQDWTTAERVSSQIYNTSERIDQNAANLAMKKLDIDAQKALQENDINAQKYIEKQKADLQLKLQTQGFNQEEKMAYIDAQLADAKANGDVDRQKQIIQFQTQENLTTMAAEFGYDKAIESVKGDIQKALQNNDFVNAEALQKARLDAEATQAAENRVLEKARIALEEKQVDMQQLESQYAQISDLVAQGVLDPSAQFEFVTKTLQAHGVDTAGYNMVDATEAAKKALNNEYELQRMQFIQTHPEHLNSTYKINNVNGLIQDLLNNGESDLAKKFLQGIDYSKDISIDDLNSVGITPEILKTYFTISTQGTELSNSGQVAMNEFINSAIYGELTTAEKEAKANAGYLNENDIPLASAGDKFNVTNSKTITDANGKSVTIPPGKYYVDTKSNTHGNSFAGKTTVDHMYLYNENGERVAELKQNTTKGSAGWKTMADPVLGIFEGV